MDQLSRILIRCAARETPEPRLYDLQGVARVAIQWISFEQLLDSAFEQIRVYSKGDIAVSLRLLRALCDIGMTCKDIALREVLVERGKRVVRGCSERIGPQELSPLVARLALLEGVAAS